MKIKVNEQIGEFGYEGNITIIDDNGKKEVYDLAPTPVSKKINSGEKAVIMAKLSAQLDVVNAKNPYAIEAQLANKTILVLDTLLQYPEQLTLAA